MEFEDLDGRYVDDNGDKYDGFYGDSNNPDGIRGAIMEAVDKLSRQPRFQKILEEELQHCEILPGNEITFREGFRMGMGFMLLLTSKGTVRSETILVKKKRKSWLRRKLARILGIAPSDCRR